MRFVKYMVLAALLALLVSLSAFARSKNEHSVFFPDSVQVGATQLKAGTYKVEWQGSASALQVSFLRDGKVVATSQGKMVEKNVPFSSDEIVTTNVHNAQRLEAIDFGGKKDALVFASDQTARK